MSAVLTSRVSVLYGLGAMALVVMVCMVFQVGYDPPSQLDPEPALAPWHHISEGKAPSKSFFIPGKGGKCKRTVRIVLDAGPGLGSSLMLLQLPGLTIARHYGYTPLIDDSSFNYGRLTDFLEPMQLDCDPGEDWQVRPRRDYHAEGWENEDHIVIYRAGLVHPGGAYVDNFWRNEFMLQGQSQAIQGIDNKALHDAFTTMPYLPSEMSFSQATRPAFRAIYRTATELFSLTPLMKAELEALVQTTRPARRAGVPVLGAIVRLGDKRQESNWNPGANAFENWQGYADVLREQLDLLTFGRKITAKPILIVMSDDAPIAIDGLRSILGEDEFDIRAIGVPVEVMPFLESDDRYVPPPPSVDRRRGHKQWDFNSQPELERVAQARTFVRDLYYMARHTDSLVVSSSSNVGRVALILAGEEKAYGALSTDATPFKAIGGLSRSIDTRWFPCVFYVGCFR